jgi:hypothetical protein
MAVVCSFMLIYFLVEVFAYDAWGLVYRVAVRSVNGN